jgi:TolA-binding protein
MLNIATAQLDLGEAAPARRTLEDLVAKYPKSDAAIKAKQRLAGR